MAAKALRWTVGWLAISCTVVIAPLPVAAGDYITGNTVIEIWKGTRQMQLREGDTVIREFRVALGTEPTSGKEVLGDGRTPEGHYYVAEKNRNSRFRRFLGISYPNPEDADRGYVASLIDAEQWAEIYLANLRGEVPPFGTLLGGRIGIHGYGGRPEVPVDWTEGCIAVGDAEIDYLFRYVRIGTPVIIHE